MAKEKQDINPEQFNEFLTYVATKVEPTQIKDIFTGKALKETIGMFKEDNPLIKSYKLTGAGFINKLLQDKTDFNLTNNDKKLIIEVGAFGDPDPRSGFKLNMSDSKIADKVEKMSVDLAEKKEKLSNDEYQSYKANARKKLVNDVLKFKVAETVFDNEAPKLDVSERDRSKPFSDFITKELNMQSGYGFNPEIPDFAGGTVGKKYIPANDQERYRTTTISSEAYPDTTTTRDRLENFSLDKESGYLRGPEGLFYNPETEQFLQQKDVYGPAPQLQGYQYDPRLKGILSTAVNPNYGSQFNQGGLTGYVKGGNMNIKEQTQNVAAQGRYGDSMLLHVNPAEVKGLAQAMPITVNPQTGQPEAFLPFLAPILGSMAGTSLLATTLGSKALAAGIGAGLATYAQTGGSGSKALLSGLTAGFGTNALNTGAQSSQIASDIATQTAADTASAQIAQGIADGTAGQATTLAAQQAAGAGAREAATKAVTDAAITMPRVATGPLQATKDIFAGGFDQGAKSLATGLMSPSGMVAGASLGTQGVINSQELFEEQMRQMEMDEEERKRNMYANNPEVQLYSAAGGLTQFQSGGDTNYGYESKKQVYAPAKQQYAVNPDFMAGFAPETMYFRPDTLNAPSMSTRGGSRPTLGADTYTGTKGGYDYEGSYDADGNFVAGTAQGVQFAPQTAIDPYAAYTGSAPQGLVQSAYNPYPVQPMSMSPTDETQDTSDYGGIGGEDFYGGDPNFDFSFYNATDSAGNPLTSSPYGAYDQQAVQDIRDQYSNYFFDYNDIQDFYRDEMSNIGRQAGGDTDKKMPNKGLEALNKVAPDVVNKMGYQEGGQTDPLIQEVTMFILGESDDQQVVNQFVDKYGVEAFTKLREEILQSLVPNAQTSGLIEGVGNGGMDDDIMGTIGNKEKIAVSQDEFIVPADVVSMLGDGSSDAGSKELYDMMDRVRMKKTGTTKQAPKLANAGGLLPA